MKRDGITIRGAIEYTGLPEQWVRKAAYSRSVPNIGTRRERGRDVALYDRAALLGRLRLRALGYTDRSGRPAVQAARVRAIIVHNIMITTGASEQLVLMSKREATRTAASVACVQALQNLAAETGLSEDYLYRIVYRQQYKTVTLSMLDRILTGLDRLEAWHVEFADVTAAIVGDRDDEVRQVAAVLAAAPVG